MGKVLVLTFLYLLEIYEGGFLIVFWKISFTGNSKYVEQSNYIPVIAILHLCGLYLGNVAFRNSAKWDFSLYFVISLWFRVWNIQLLRTQW